MICKCVTNITFIGKNYVHSMLNQVQCHPRRTCFVNCHDLPRHPMWWASPVQHAQCHPTDHYHHGYLHIYQVQSRHLLGIAGYKDVALHSHVVPAIKNNKTGLRHVQGLDTLKLIHIQARA